MTATAKIKGIMKLEPYYVEEIESWIAFSVMVDTLGIVYFIVLTTDYPIVWLYWATFIGSVIFIKIMKFIILTRSNIVCFMTEI